MPKRLIHSWAIIGGLLTACLLAVNAPAEYVQTTYELNYPSVSTNGYSG